MTFELEYLQKSDRVRTKLSSFLYCTLFAVVHIGKESVFGEV